MLALTDAEVMALGDGEIVLRDGCLGAEVASALHAEAIALSRDLRPARMRSGRDATVRGDDLLWVEPPALAALCAFFAALQAELSSAAYLGLGGHEVQLARYLPGAAYARHRDAFADATDSRRATAIYYLNPGWTEADGGQLRVHGEGGARDVAPLLDRLVLFRSPLVEHEVLPANAPRLAVTAWYHGPSWSPSRSS